MFMYSSDTISIKEDEISVTFKLNRLMLNDKNPKLSNRMKNKFTKNNVLTIYSLA